MHRSAISVYHDLVDGARIGAHPTIVSIMSGIKNLRPVKSRYHVIWDVQKVLNYIKTLGEPSSMSLKTLLLKTAMLLSLVMVSRVSEINLLETSSMCIPKEGNKIVFFHNNDERAKTESNSLVPLSLEIFAFEEDTSLCPVDMLNNYLSRTKELRGPHTPLLVKTVKPYSPVKRSTIANWEQVLANCGVDISVFKAHSTRSAATSGAKVKGATIKDILSRGNWSNKYT